MLLRTRFYIPPFKQEHLLRERLLESLQQTQGGELVLISAPAGYGKTTLVSQWLHSHSHSFAWLIVDESQGVAEVFWQHIIEALQTLVADIAQQSLEYLRQKDINKTVIALLNDLDRLDVTQQSEHAYTLVMDDFHKAQSADNLASLNLFLDHLPPCLRVVMTVRQDPGLALPRRRANGQLKLIQQQDLAFNLKECQAFLSNKLNTSISDDLAEKITLATEGWVTGIQLSSMSSHTLLDPEKAADHDLNRDMADYLFDEVFSQQPSAIQDFLLATSLLDKFCPALSNHLCQLENSFQLIKQIEADNLFIIALDNHRSWYRYHDLFRQFLRLQVQNLAQSQQLTLHSRARDWLEQAGYYQLAFEHSLTIQDWPSCESLFTLLAQEKQALGIEHSLLPLLAQLPEALAESLSKGLHLVTQATKPVNLAGPALDLIEPLTQREAQVMTLVQQGLSNKDIAEQLFISPNTLKVHIRNLYGKMGVENRTQALIKMQG
jgi:LuxR family maltose regulon positive regulatory protein